MLWLICAKSYSFIGCKKEHVPSGVENHAELEESCLFCANIKSDLNAKKFELWRWTSFNFLVCNTSFIVHGPCIWLDIAVGITSGCPNAWELLYSGSCTDTCTYCWFPVVRAYVWKSERWKQLFQSPMEAAHSRAAITFEVDPVHIQIEGGRSSISTSARAFVRERRSIWRCRESPCVARLHPQQGHHLAISLKHRRNRDTSSFRGILTYNSRDDCSELYASPSYS